MIFALILAIILCSARSVRALTNGRRKIVAPMKITSYKICPERQTLSKVQDRLLNRRHLLAIAFIFVALLFLSDIAKAKSPSDFINLRDPNVRRQRVEQLAEQARQKKDAAWAIAEAQGWAPKGDLNGKAFELMAIENGSVYVYETCNANAGISIGVDQIRNTFPYDVNGAGLTVGLWDAGAPRLTHQEFGGRITVKDGSSVHYHATHVAGTLAAAGVDANAIGMAPAVRIDSYNWTADTTEMTATAMTYPNEPNTIQISNHSYGYAAGWDHNYTPPRWWGTWGNDESHYFGIYDSMASDWDQVCYGSHYLLPFKAAGNDRDDPTPSEGALFEYYAFKMPAGWDWQQKNFDSSEDPLADGWDDGGFDTVSSICNAKNIVTVGSINDAVTDGVRDITKATMTTLSGWGPTDDGRIKPDVVTNGATIYSTSSGGDTIYVTYSGTSMAAPSAAGMAMLLTDLYGQLFPADAMRASTIKALIIHTADDLGNAGPDYKFGWGLINAKTAADQIIEYRAFPDANKIDEGLLDDVNTVANYTFEWDGESPIRATICWTDPAAAALTTVDNTSPRLINDLDLQITDPCGTIAYPFVLNPASPNNLATNGDNVLDNVEQILISSPTIPGDYTIQISYKGTLTNDQQYYSLILSGQTESLLSEFTGDGEVDFKDLAELVTYWLENEPSIDIAPSEGDGIVNFLDFSRFAQDW